MNEYQEKLIHFLLEKNNQLTSMQARTWIELLWEDFESTYAKAGREYLGNEMTEKIVRQWIQYHGGNLHQYKTNNPKFRDLLNQHDNIKH